MNKIVRKEQFSEKVFLFEIEAPLIAKSRKAGNFVIVRIGENGERMPLTIPRPALKIGTTASFLPEITGDLHVSIGVFISTSSVGRSLSAS